MRALRARDIGELVRSDDFRSWFETFTELRLEIDGFKDNRKQALAEIGHLREHARELERLAEEGVMLAGELDDTAGHDRAAYAEIENDAFESLSEFETHRQTSTDLWAQASAAEKELEDRRLALAEMRLQFERASDTSQRDSMEAQLKGLDQQVLDAGHAAHTARRRLDSSEKERDEHWRTVESSWSRSFRSRIAATEHAYQARRERKHAELNFAAAEQEKARILDLEKFVAEADNRLTVARREFQKVTDDGGRAFGCVLIQDFLYWPAADGARDALCVPLIEESEHLNIAVKPLGIYRIDRQKGLDLLEPLISEDEGGDDPRLGSFFSDRPGAGSIGGEHERR